MITPMPPMVTFSVNTPTQNIAIASTNNPTKTQ